MGTTEDFRRAGLTEGERRQLISAGMCAVYWGMDNSVDLRSLLERWPYDAEDNVRKVRCPDGREVLQVRLPLGIEQYELTGRPDGARPYGQESVLDYFLQRLNEDAKSDSDSDFSLDSEECEELFSEGTLYYYRYLHLFQVKDWAGTIRDTSRNLRLFDLVHRHAADEEDKMYLEQWRPYLLRMNAAASAMAQIEVGEHTRALEIIEVAIVTIERLEDLEDDTFQFEKQRSLLALREIKSQIEEAKPLSQIELLERELRKAIETQHFERAADLRDQIRALRDSA